MAIVVALFGLFIALIGALGVVSPPRLVSAVARFQSPHGLYVVAAIRIVLGFALVLAAPASRAPGFLFGFGVLALVAGILTPFFGVRRFERLLGWWSRQPSLLVRVWCALVVALGLGILFSVLP